MPNRCATKPSREKTGEEEERRGSPRYLQCSPYIRRNYSQVVDMPVAKCFKDCMRAYNYILRHLFFFPSPHSPFYRPVSNNQPASSLTEGAPLAPPKFGLVSCFMWPPELPPKACFLFSMHGFWGLYQLPFLPTTHQKRKTADMRNWGRVFQVPS
ncbi:hypothetical protein MKZ38_004965 [Zalerion maritima]|uniref:Uncharacterized protein n=1 Tax=Zalerion maritima TaxID=339359 RepID=A0AAD5WRA1_9PEZI|nr:hypothetical protein MKZ38_004965 [Zalerion maritima]